MGVDSELRGREKNPKVVLQLIHIVSLLVLKWICSFLKRARCGSCRFQAMDDEALLVAITSMASEEQESVGVQYPLLYLSGRAAGSSLQASR